MRASEPKRETSRGLDPLIARRSGPNVDEVSAAPAAPTVRGLPLVGSFLEFRKNSLTAMTNGFRQHGDLVRYQLGPVTLYVASGPDLVGELLSDGERFGKLGEDSPLRLVLGDGLLTSSDRDTWLRNRRVMQPVYTRQSVNRF